MIVTSYFMRVKSNFSEKMTKFAPKLMTLQSLTTFKGDNSTISKDLNTGGQNHAIMSLNSIMVNYY